MRILFTVVALVFVTVLHPSFAYAQNRQLANTTRTMEIFEVEPGATDFFGNHAAMAVILEECTSTFEPTSRSFEQSPGQRPGVTSPTIRTPAGCGFRRSIVGPYAIVLRDFVSQSINDLGVHTVTCPESVAASLGCTSISTPNACGRYELCLPQYFGGRTYNYRFTVEIHNEPATASISHTGTGLISDNEASHNTLMTIVADARDPDGGTPTLSWRILSRPSGAVSNLATTSGASTSIRFSGERDFGVWSIEVIVDDNEGERTRQTHDFAVVNQAPNPVISGATRVALGDNIVLQVSPDEDGGEYTAITWESLAPNTSVWETVAGSPELSIPSELRSIGMWQFRVSVTDNEVPALSGMSSNYSVEVFNPPPELTIDPVVSPVPAEDGSFEINVSALDPDGGEAQILIRTIQTPDSSGVPLGEEAARQGEELNYIQRLTIADAGTWIFEIRARDDEPAPYTGESEPVEVVLVANGKPEANISGPDQVGSLTGMVSLSGLDSNDPDTPTRVYPDIPCADVSVNCHSTVDGSPPRRITPGITRYTWSLLSASLDSGEAFELADDLRERFTIRGPTDAIEIPIAELEAGRFLFQLEVEDGEGLTDSATHNIEVIEEQGNPIAIVTPPRRFDVPVIGGLAEPIEVFGVRSFDPDNILTGDPPGIESFEWRVLYEPDDCVGISAAAETSGRLTLFNPTGFIPPACIGPYKIELTVTDDDRPTAHTGSAETRVFLKNCSEGVCIDLPTEESTYEIEFAEGADVFIYYHVDPPTAARFPLGYFARLRGFHESNPITPVFKSYEPNAVLGTSSQLMAFHWNGYWTNRRPQPGRYNISVELLDHNRVSLSPPLIDSELRAIKLEIDDLRFESGADRYANRDSLIDSSQRVRLPFAIDGTIEPDRITWRLLDSGESEIISQELPAALAGEVIWDGRINTNSNPEISVASTGSYFIEVEAFKADRSLTGPVRQPLAIYQLTAHATTGLPDDLVVLVNTDDDDMDGIPDRIDTGPVSGETDLLGTTLILDPPLAGQIRVSTGDPVPKLALNDSSIRASATMPWPAEFPVTEADASIDIYIEGLVSGEANLQLAFIPDGHSALPSVNTTFRVIDVELEDSAYSGIEFIDIAGFDSAYSASSPYGLLNTAAENFVDRDPDRFALRIQDRQANTDSGSVETGSIVVSTILADGTIDDDATEIQLFEASGAGTAVSDSSIFQSSFLVATTQDLPTNADDDIAAVEPSGSTVADDASGDRTHRATIDGGIRIHYQAAGSSRTLSYQLPVCNRNPEARRVVEIRARIFIDPTTGLPTASPSYIQAQLDKANLAWAPACIKFQLTGGTATIIPASVTPTIMTPTGPQNFLADGGNYGGQGDRMALINAFSPGARRDVFELFVVPNIATANAVTYGPFDDFPNLGLNTFMVMRSNLSPIARTLAHELGHGLGNTPDTHLRKHIFYPQRPWKNTDPTNFGYITDDRPIDNYRRISDMTIMQSRTERTVTPTPPRTALGNYALKNP